MSALPQVSNCMCIVRRFTYLVLLIFRVVKHEMDFTVHQGQGCLMVVVRNIKTETGKSVLCPRQKEGQQQKEYQRFAHPVPINQVFPKKDSRHVGYYGSPRLFVKQKIYAIS